MPSQKSNHSEAFGRLLSGAINSIATYEGKTAPIVEDELGVLAIVAGKTIQRYKSGYLPPERRTIEILAEAAVKRGFLGREWLQRFLHAGRYAFADKLLDQLCPAALARPHPPRVYENLPAPTYHQFVMRAQAFADVIDGLQQRSAVVLIVGMGGNGKTSLAREVAAQCLQDDDVPRFDAVVWVSDQDSRDTTNLSSVLDEIARTLDYPGLTQFAHDEKLYEVGQLLKRQRVLVVIDNFETIADRALLTWLLRLPEPSKAIITSREYSRTFRNSTFVVELRGMSEGEAREFVEQRLRVLQIDRLVSDQIQLEPLQVVTSGNPKAIEIALGLVKYERRPLSQVVDDLYAARSDLFDDLFTRAWALLDDAARRVLLVMIFFPISANGEALSATADVQGFAFHRAVERLTDLALLDVQQDDLNIAPRYLLHPLVRAYMGARLAELPELEESARVRWVRYFIDFADQQFTCTVPRERYWKYLSTSESASVIDVEWLNIQQVLQWTDDRNMFEMLLELTTCLLHYMDRRMMYSYRIHYVHKAINATMYLKRPWHENILRINALAWTLIEQGSLDDAEKEINTSIDMLRNTDMELLDKLDLFALSYAYIARIQLFRKDIIQSEAAIEYALSLNCSSIIRYRVTRIAGEVALAKKDTSTAIELLTKARLLAKETENRNMAATDSLGFAYLENGDVSQAKALFVEILEKNSHDFIIPIARATYGLACIAKKENQIMEARQLAEDTLDIISKFRIRHWLLDEVESFLADISSI